MQSKTDISDFLAERPHAPVAGFQEIYDSRRFHPLNDLFHDIANGSNAIDGEVECCADGSTRSTYGG